MHPKKIIQIHNTDFQIEFHFFSLSPFIYGKRQNRTSWRQRAKISVLIENIPYLPNQININPDPQKITN
jgi:hypothetical protein